MMSFFTSMFGWMPPALEYLCMGVVVIFFLATILRVIKFVLDIIPFL